MQKLEKINREDPVDDMLKYSPEPDSSQIKSFDFVFLSRPDNPSVGKLYYECAYSNVLTIPDLNRISMFYNNYNFKPRDSPSSIFRKIPFPLEF